MLRTAYVVGKGMKMLYKFVLLFTTLSLTIPALYCMEPTLIVSGSGDEYSINTSGQSCGLFCDEYIYETAAPTAGPLVWPMGYPIQPIFGERFGLRCPLEANTPPVYWWKKFATLDMAEPVNLTDELTFTEDGRTWRVNSYTEEYNGMYVCYASNSLGVAEYVNVGLFYLHTDRCIHQQSVAPSLHISPSGLIEGRPGDNVTLTCNALNTVQNSGNNGKPYWWVERNGNQRERCGSPNYIQESSFDELRCKWTAVLIIRNFSSDLIGRYYCGYHNIGHSTSHFVNQTVHYEACYINSEHDNVSLAITPVNITYTEGSDILLLCTASYVAPDNAYVPVWSLPPDSTLDCPNGTVNECNSSSHEMFESSFDKERCQWTSRIVVKGFKKSQEGTYSCQVGDHKKNITLQMLYPEVNSTLKTLMSSRKAAIVLASIVAIIIAVSALITIIITRNYMKISYVKSKEPPYNGFKHDVFISVANEAKDFAEDKIIFPLQSECSPPYKVCWHMQDFICGLPIEEQIVDAVMQSRKIIFIFSENFLKSNWCVLELQYALHRLLKTRTRCIIPITLSDGAVPKDLKQRITYWPIVNITSDSNITNRIIELIGDRIPDLEEHGNVDCDCKDDYR